MLQATASVIVRICGLLGQIHRSEPSSPQGGRRRRLGIFFPNSSPQKSVYEWNLWFSENSHFFSWENLSFGQVPLFFFTEKGYRKSSPCRRQVFSSSFSLSWKFSHCRCPNLPLGSGHKRVISYKSKSS